MPILSAGHRSFVLIGFAIWCQACMLQYRTAVYAEFWVALMLLASWLQHKYVFVDAMQPAPLWSSAAEAWRGHNSEVELPCKYRQINPNCMAAHQFRNYSMLLLRCSTLGQITIQFNFAKAMRQSCLSASGKMVHTCLVIFSPRCFCEVMPAIAHTLMAEVWRSCM